MRDGRRVREKFDFSLEPKQLALLFVLCLVILVPVFALGIIVGRGLKNPAAVPDTAQTAPAEPAADAPPTETAAMEETPAPAAPDTAPKLKFFANGSQTPAHEADAVIPPPGPEAPSADAAAAPNRT